MLPSRGQSTEGARFGSENASLDRREPSHLFEECLSRFQLAAWDELAAVTVETLAAASDRAKAAILVAAAKAHCGDEAGSRELLRDGLAWGCNPVLAAQVLASMVHNSLGRMAAALEDERSAEEHFGQSLSLVGSPAQSKLLARTRRVHETARMGLLLDAEKLIREDAKAIKVSPADHVAELEAMRTEIDVLGYELALALRRNQIMTVSGEKGDASPHNEQGAVSQLGQDLWVLERTGRKRGGYFVEFGATDGVRLSNTYLLETEFQWSGLCAEPNPTLFEQLKKNRRCVTSSACIGERTGEEVEFILAEAFGGISDYASADHHAERRSAFKRAGRVMRVTTISLEDFLIENHAPREIDYLSIDTEGSEYAILRAFPFDRWRIRLITVEHNRTAMRDRIRDLLVPLGYTRTEVEFDDWYELTNS